jgi:hypothetical protein
LLLRAISNRGESGRAIGSDDRALRSRSGSSALRDVIQDRKSAGNDVVSATWRDDERNVELVYAMIKIYSEPQVGEVIRYMQQMSKSDRLSLQIVARAFAGRHKKADTAEVMRSALEARDPKALTARLCPD